MRYISTPVGGLPASVLGFGCGALMGRAGRKESLAALGAAWDAGINFYDTARSYGYGESEGLLGEFFEKRRAGVFICTKFGILPGERNWKSDVMPVARKAVQMFPALRGLARMGAASQIVRGDFSVPLLHKSFEDSLRALRMDYVDILLLHAAPMTALAYHDLLDALTRLVEQGKVRMAGVSGEHDVVLASFERSLRPFATAQFAMNPMNMGFVPQTQKAERGGWFLVANHPYGGPEGVAKCKRRIEALRRDKNLPKDLRKKLKPDAQLMPEVVLNTITNRTGVHVVIPAMTKPENIRSNVAAIENCRFTADELALLRNALL